MRRINFTLILCLVIFVTIAINVRQLDKIVRRNLALLKFARYILPIYTSQEFQNFHSYETATQEDADANKDYVYFAEVWINENRLYDGKNSSKQIDERIEKEEEEEEKEETNCSNNRSSETPAIPDESTEYSFDNSIDILLDLLNGTIKNTTAENGKHTPRKQLNERATGKDDYQKKRMNVPLELCVKIAIERKLTYEAWNKCVCSRTAFDNDDSLRRIRVPFYLNSNNCTSPKDALLVIDLQRNVWSLELNSAELSTESKI